MGTLISKALADYTGNEAANAAGVAILGGFMLIWIIVAIIALIGFIFWLWALIDCLKRNFTGSEKTTWIVVLIVGFFFGLGWLSAIIYLIIGKPKGVLPSTSQK